MFLRFLCVSLCAFGLSAPTFAGHPGGYGGHAFAVSNGYATGCCPTAGFYPSFAFQSYYQPVVQQAIYQTPVVTGVAQTYQQPVVVAQPVYQQAVYAAPVFAVQPCYGFATPFSYNQVFIRSRAFATHGYGNAANFVRHR